MKAYARDPDKRPAAVVLLTRGPLVLAITCKGQIASLQLPGGKSERKDMRSTGKRDLCHTAHRELYEEAGIVSNVDNMHHLVDYVAHTGRFVRVFTVATGPAPQPNPEWPDEFEPTEAGWPGWVHPGALLTRWCTYREECAEILRAAAKTNDELAMVLIHEHLTGAL